METKYWKFTNEINNNEQIIAEAANLLRDGSTVSFPTETVYGLGADATSETAVAKIFKAKGRPQDNPLIAHVANKEQLMELVSHVPDYAHELIDAFSPGPITFVLPSNGKCVPSVTAGLSTIGIRIPDHPIAHQLLTKANTPIAAPSANTSGRPSPTMASHVADDLMGKISGIIDGGRTGVGMESTVVKCTDESGPVILRPGGVTKEQLEQVVGHVTVDPALVDGQTKPQSPGMKYKHYAPEVPLYLISGDGPFVQSFINEEKKRGLRVGVIASQQMGELIQADQLVTIGQDITEVAAHLYDALRSFKEEEVDVIVCQAFSELGIGQAVMNRLRKAAKKEIIQEDK